MTAVPPIDAQTAARNQRQAILLAIFTMFCFTIMDACVKGLAPRVGVVPALWARYSGQMLVVLLLVLPRLGQTVRTSLPVLQITRSVLLLCGTGFFFFGVSMIPLTDATALMAVSPVIVTLGAALFLGEALGLRRIMGIAVAMCGAAVIIRPGSGVFSLGSVLPLIAACCYSAYILVTRKVGHRESVWTSLFYTGLVGTVVLTAVVPFFWQTPDLIAIGLMGMIALFGTAGQLSLIRAYSLGEASMLAPYTYTGLVFAAFWGFTIFGEVPDKMTALGTLVIASAGIYVWHREMNSK